MKFIKFLILFNFALTYNFEFSLIVIMFTLIYIVMQYMK